MLELHPENAATRLVVGGLAMLLLRHLMVWRLDRSRSHLPWVLTSASGIAFGVLRIAHLSTDSPDHALTLSRGLYAVPMSFMPLGVAAVETLTERPSSRTTFRLCVVTALLAIATVATPWFVVGPPQLRHDALGHRFWVGNAGPGLLAVALLIAWTGWHLYRAVRALPVELRGVRRWLRLMVLVFMAVAVHDTLVASGLRSIHLFEYGYLVFAAIATQFETLRELVFGVPGYRVVNAAFTHAHPLGSRINGPDRGAWYAAFETKTAQAEVTFHRTLQLAEIGRFEDDVTFDDYLADFSGEFHDLRGADDWAECLDPDSYVQSQWLAERLLERGSLGIVYPSVRRAGGTCLACFRPALVMNVRKGATYRFRWSGKPTPAIAAVKPA